MLAAAVLAALAATPAAQAASVHRVDAHGKISIGSSGVTVELTGTPFVRCRGTLAPTGPTVAILRARCSHGRIVVRTRETNASGSRGTWRVVSGSGRYRKARGSGRYSGSFRTFKIRFRGIARY